MALNIVGEKHEQVMFNHACSFREAAKLIQASRKHFIPFVVCYTFAIEVLLKLLLGRSREGGHNVSDIFEMLPKATQEAIQAVHDAKPRLPAEQLHLRLKRIGNAFETWRYSYEDLNKVQTVVVGDLEEVSSALVTASLKLKPHLKEPK